MASRRSSPFGPGLPLALLRFWLWLTSAARLLPYAAASLSPHHKSPPPGTARAAPPRCVARHATVVPAKPWVGVRQQRHCAALRTAGRMAACAQRALPHLTRVDCSSTANEVSGA